MHICRTKEKEIVDHEEDQSGSEGEGDDVNRDSVTDSSEEEDDDDNEEEIQKVREGFIVDDEDEEIESKRKEDTRKERGKENVKKKTMHWMKMISNYFWRILVSNHAVKEINSKD